jgi:hypothetical protein
MKKIMLFLFLLAFAALSDAPTHSVQVVLNFDKMSIEQLADFEKDILKKYHGVKIEITVDPPCAGSGIITLPTVPRWQYNNGNLLHSPWYDSNGNPFGVVTQCLDSLRYEGSGKLNWR